MPHEMIDIMTSVIALMNEETAKLQGREPAPDLPELATAKARLVGRLEGILARRNRHQPDWMDELAEDDREKLTNCLAELQIASLANSSILERQIELSTEMLGAITSEVRRLSGNRTYAYGAGGEMARMDVPTPISFNTEY